jgi:TolB-like protein/Flp pilus assembly protein TadD
MIGKTISHYKITEKLGEGGMGEVFLAEDTHLHCNRALKFLPVTVTPDSPNHVRLVNEARALAALEHQNICPVQEIGEHNGQTFIVMSYLEGRTLKDRMAEGPIPLDEALEISRQISAGLAAAHAKGIVHRDVKPDNVMLTETNGETQGPLRAVLMDFGIAKNRDTTLVTRTGTVMGTAAYMSPEQAQGEKVEAASDVWAVGVLLYEMLAGKRPFQGDLEPALLYAIVNVDPEPLVGADQEVSESVERVIGKALAKDRGDRYANAAELLVDLDRAVAGEAVKGRRLEKRRRSPLVGAAAAVIGLALVVLFVWPGFLATTDAISVLAVMPLEDRSGEADQAYFSEGIADELAAGLSKISALTIISTNTSSRARELYDSNQEIGAELGVDALLEGSIQRVGDRIKVSVQLVATNDDRLLWSESYTRDMRDILNLQSEISLAISSALEAELTAGEQENLARDRQVNPEALEAYLIGKSFVDKWSQEDVEKGIGYLEQALEHDPDFAEAYAGLATAYVFSVTPGGGWRAPGEVVEKAREAATRALELDESLGEAHMALGAVSMAFDWDLEIAEREFKRAIELNPSFANARTFYAGLLKMDGLRNAEALDQLELALQADPLNIHARNNVIWWYFEAGDYARVHEECRQYFDLNPGPVLHAAGLLALSSVMMAEGQVEDAMAGFERCVELTERRHSGYLSFLGKVYESVGRHADAMSVMNEMVALSKEGYVSPVNFAQLHAAMGNFDEAFEELERAYELRCGFMIFFTGYCPELRSDPRWGDLVERVGLPDRAPMI